MKFRYFILLSLQTLIISINAAAVQLPKIDFPITGITLMSFNSSSPIITTVEVPGINLSQLNTADKKTFFQNTIELNLNNQSSLDEDAKITIEANFNYFPIDGSAALNESITLEVDFKSGALQKSNISNVYTLRDAYKIELTITNVQLTGASGSDIELLKDKIKDHIELVISFQEETISRIDFNSVVNSLSACKDINTDELIIKWQPAPNAEEYELEYTYVDDYTGSYTTVIPPNQIKYDFKNNSTRISLKDSYYRVPLIFERGWILFRVRAIGKGGPDLDVVIHCKWSGTSENGFVNAFPNKFRNAAAHMSDKMNYQVTSTFVEDGKRSDVVNYYDATFRSRQTVTGTNLEKKDVKTTGGDIYPPLSVCNSPGTEKEREVIAGETIYDFQGRPSVNILPAPTNSKRIAYIKLLNISDVSKKPYNFTDFDKQSFDCKLSNKLDANLYSGLMGASSYYSEKNPNKFGFNAFIPDAHGYPFTQLIYTPDNTGKVSVQGGLDETFQLGKGHETRFLYGAPDQTELDRMFGTEVGDSKRYQKNAVVDQNGQVSVTYINPEGKTIATSLAGIKPDNLEALPEYTEVLNNQNNNTITVSLLNKNEVDDIDKTITTENQFIVTSKSNYKFEYSIDPEILNTDKCDGTPVCLDCIYDIDLTLTHVEKCDVIPLFKRPGTTIGQLLDSQGNPDLICNGNGKDETDFDIILEVGTYVLTKKITVNKQAGIDYVNEVFKDTCQTKWQEILDEELSRIDTMDCYNSCLDCEQPPVQTETCNTVYCKPNPNRCDIIKGMMMADVSPGGQYAELDRLSNGDFISPYPLSIFNENNVLPGKITVAILQNLSTSYNFPYDNTKSLTENIKTLVNNWHPEYAEGLLQLHPEYCMTDWCESPGIDNTLNYDVKLLSANYYSDAIDENLIDPSHPNISTQLLDSDPWFSIPANASYRIALNSLLLSYGCGSITKPISDIAMEMAFCAFHNPPQNMPGKPQMNDPLQSACNPPANYTANHVFGNDNIAPAPGQNSLADLEWNFLRALYISAKNIVLQESMDDYATVNNCNDNCIGEYHPYSIFSSTNIPPCNIFSSLYRDKEKRFGSETKSTFKAVNDAGISIDFSGVDFNNLCQVIQAVQDQSGSINQQVASDFCDSLDSPCNITKGLTNVFNTALNNFDDSTLILSGIQIPQALKNIGLNTVTASKSGRDSLNFSFQPLNFKVTLPLKPVNSIYMVPRSVCITNVRQVAVGSSFKMKIAYENNSIDERTYQISYRIPEENSVTVNNSNPQLDAVNYSIKRYLNNVFDYNTAYKKFPSDLQLVSLLPPELRTKNNKTAESVNISTSGNFVVNINYSDNSQSNSSVKIVSNKKRDIRNYRLTGQNKAETVRIVLQRNDRLSSWSDISRIIDISNLNNSPNDLSANSFTSTAITGSDTNTLLIKGDVTFVLLSSTVSQITLCDSLPKLPEYPFTNNCADGLRSTAYNNAKNRYGQWLDSMKNDLLERYYDKCLKAVEKLDMTYTDLQYHYTLYYYDQADNLVKTIPPAGVHLLDANQIVATDNSRKNNYNSTITPAHTKYSDYRFNTLNELVWQETPDAGESNFYYDLLGRISASQNAEQFLNGYFSYTRYDKQGRNVESGKVKSNIIDQQFTRDFNNWENFIIGNNDRYEITLTKYDETTQDIDLKFSSTGQTNLRKRVASIFSFENSATLASNSYIHATHFSYDIIGNVYKLVQDYPNGIIGDKTIEYSYDLQSGKVNSVTYQAGALDQFIHKYSYDAINRLTKVRTSTNGLFWETDAEYFYYRHGPLARMELGTDKVQGLDYLYTLQGWIKGVNGTTLTASTDMGQDGITGNTSSGPGYGTRHNPVARDAFGYILEYFNSGITKDYKPISPNTCLDGLNNQTGMVNPLFNGNISRMYTQIQNLGNSGQNLSNTGFNYSYDQLNRFMSHDGWYLDGSSMQPLGDAYTMDMKYDADGNILELNRNGSSNIPGMDKLQYMYYKNDNVNTYDPLTGIPADATNKLAFVNDDPSLSGNYAEDIDDQESNNYRYDAIGNLIGDNSENISNIEWNLQNKIKKITKTDGNTIDFQYDALGNRVMKAIHNIDPGTDIITYYTKDAQGNVMAIYSQKPDPDDEGNLKLFWEEANLYGSSRLGIYSPDLKLDDYEMTNKYLITRGYMQYELTNHLGNVLATITDRKLPVTQGNSTTYTADIFTSQDYYPFGMMMPGRKLESENYKYGFNNQEKDDQIYGNGNLNTAQFWEYDTRLGRRWNLDPLSYAWQTSYSTFNNNSIVFTDPFGLFGSRKEAKEYKKENKLSGRVRKSDDGLFSIDDKKVGTSTYKDSEFGIVKAVLVEAKRPDNAKITPWGLGIEWASGLGARSRSFTEGDYITNMYLQHGFIKETKQKVREKLKNVNGEMKLPIEGNSPYSLSGVEGVGKYLKDYSTLATGGLTGNLIYTFLGSHNLEFSITDVDIKTRTAIVTFFMFNTSTIQSATRPPVLGYQEWYKNSIGKAVDNQFRSGPFSETEQSIEWTEKIKY